MVSFPDTTRGCCSLSNTKSSDTIQVCSPQCKQNIQSHSDKLISDCSTQYYWVLEGIFQCPADGNPVTDSVISVLYYREMFLFRSWCIPWPPHSLATHRMEFCTCWTATNASNQSQSAFKTARISLTWSSPVKRESMTKCWRVRLLITNVLTEGI